MRTNAWIWFGILTMGGLAASACSDEPDDTTGSGGTGAAGGATTTTTTTIASTSVTTTSGTGGGSCYNEQGALVAPAGSSSVAGQGDCTAQQVADFYTACFEGDTTTCTDYQAANADCVGCLLPVDENGNANGFSPVIFQSMMFAYANYMACEAAVAGLPDCGPPVSSLIFCANTACEACENGTPENDACFQQATSAGGICADNITVPAECQPLLDLEELSPECGGEATEFEGFYNAIGNYLCGPDGGAGGGGAGGGGGGGGAP